MPTKKKDEWAKPTFMELNVGDHWVKCEVIKTYRRKEYLVIGTSLVDRDLNDPLYRGNIREIAVKFFRDRADELITRYRGA